MQRFRALNEEDIDNRQAAMNDVHHLFIIYSEIACNDHDAHLDDGNGKHRLRGRGS